jgi:flagellar FliJ protein
MKKFRFRLQKVLEYRETKREEKARELAERNNHLSQAEQSLNNITAAHDAANPEEFTSIADIELVGRYRETLRDSLDHQRQLVEEAAEAVEVARDAYVEKAIDAEVLGTLRERRFLEFREERMRRERKQTDQLVVQRYRLRDGQDTGES